MRTLWLLTVANIKSVYASSYLTTRDQIPNLK